jgi:hypothetical protein
MKLFIIISDIETHTNYNVKKLFFFFREPYYNNQTTKNNFNFK